MSPDNTVSTPELPRDRVKHVSQHDNLDSPLNELSNNFCGLAAVSAITGKDIPTILQTIAKITKLPKIDAQGREVPTNYWKEIMTKDQKVPILAGTKKILASLPESIRKLEDIEAILNDNSDRVTPFSLLRGYMHPYSPQLFTEFGRDARMIGDKSNHIDKTAFENILKRELVMASVDNKIWKQVGPKGEWGEPTNKEIGSHVVLVVSQEGNKYKVMDPNSKVRSLVEIDTAQFHRAFNGYGTAVKMKSA